MLTVGGVSWQGYVSFAESTHDPRMCMYRYDTRPRWNVSETKSYLTASLDIECNGPAHQPIIALAVGFIVVWPLAMPLLYAILLYRCRGPIQNHQPSPLSRAIRFLWSDYKDGYYWYEMVLLTNKLVREDDAVLAWSLQHLLQPIIPMCSTCSCALRIVHNLILPFYTLLLRRC